MKLFYHHVGLKGAEEDFKKTIFKRVPISTVISTIPDEHHLKNDIVQGLHSAFPSGDFNCWGVPVGASRVISNLAIGDGILLIKTTQEEGEVPALCLVKAYWKEQLRPLSKALWGDDKYPYIFFFDTQKIDLSWKDMLGHLGYEEKYDPRGTFNSIGEKRLTSFDGAEGYFNYLQKNHGSSGLESQSSDRSSQLVVTGLKETAPPKQGLAVTKPRTFQVRKDVDYSAKDAADQQIGLAGELLVFQKEKNDLIAQGKHLLAEQVVHTSQTQGDGAGYDILSFDAYGNKKFIEVKTTEGPAESAFLMSANEVEFSNQHPDSFFLYRVYDYDKASNSGSFYVVKGVIGNSFHLTPTQYRVTR